MNLQSKIFNLQFLVLSICGAIAAVAFAAIRFRGLPLGSPSFLLVVAVTVAAYVAALFVVRKTRSTPMAWLIVALLAIAMRVPLAAAPVGASSDMLRYVWDARMQRAGVSPYVAVPKDPRYAHLHTDATRLMNNDDIPSPYPPGAQLFFRAATAVRESPEALKVALVACDLTIALILGVWLRSTGRNPLIAIAYAWNPLVVLEVAHSGHFDVAGALAVTIAAFALSRGHRAVSVVALAAGVAIKFLPIVLVPLFWRRVRLVHAALGVLVIAALYAWFYDPSNPVPLGSATNMVRTFRFNGPVFKAIAFLSSPWIAGATSVGLGLTVAVLLRRSRVADDPGVWAWPMAAALVCAPLVYPWYLLWLTPFFIARLTWPLILWSLMILPVYTVWQTGRDGGLWAVPFWMGFLEYGVLFATSAWLFRALLRRDFESESTPRQSTAVVR